MTLRVVQFSTGHVGRHSLRAISNDPGSNSSVCMRRVPRRSAVTRRSCADWRSPPEWLQPMTLRHWSA